MSCFLFRPIAEKENNVGNNARSFWMPEATLQTRSIGQLSSTTLFNGGREKQLLNFYPTPITWESRLRVRKGAPQSQLNKCLEHFEIKLLPLQKISGLY
jgi:hypothetical protein